MQKRIEKKKGNEKGRKRVCEVKRGWIIRVDYVDEMKIDMLLYNY
jgi:hypothetical protein